MAIAASVLVKRTRGKLGDLTTLKNLKAKTVDSWVFNHVKKLKAKSGRCSVSLNNWDGTGVLLRFQPR
jgi:hypothetical protein